LSSNVAYNGQIEVSPPMMIQGIYEPTTSESYLRKLMKKKEPKQKIYDSAVDLFLGYSTNSIDENMFTIDLDEGNEAEEIDEDSVSIYPIANLII
jgi:hypothetical protein